MAATVAAMMSHPFANWQEDGEVRVRKPGAKNDFPRPPAFGRVAQQTAEQQATPRRDYRSGAECFDVMPLLRFRLFGIQNDR